MEMEANKIYYTQTNYLVLFPNSESWGQKDPWRLFNPIAYQLCQSPVEIMNGQSSIWP